MIASSGFLLAVLAITPAQALTLLTVDKHGVFQQDPRTGEGSAWIEVGADPHLAPLEDPSACPASASVEIRAYPTATNLLEGGPAVDLPCERWSSTPLGWVYRDRQGSAGGVTWLRYGTSGIELRAETPSLFPVRGPVGYVELWLTIGAKRYLVRFHNFEENGERLVIASRPSPDAAAGEAAFWDTLLGDADRAEESLALLERAALHDSRDGRSSFLAGMIGLFRYGREVEDQRSAGEHGRRLIRDAKLAFDKAVPLLWDGESGDSRVPGFASAAGYAKGYVYRDPKLIAESVEIMSDVAERNPLFNSFIPFGLAPTVTPTSPEYAWILELLDVVFPSVAGECTDQREICFNDGLAPHNLEGTFVLFGDLYAKGNRPAEAKSYYELAASIGAEGGWRPEFVERARTLAAQAEERTALYQDGDPSNDPPFTGQGTVSGCAYCHFR